MAFIKYEAMIEPEGPKSCSMVLPIPQGEQRMEKFTTSYTRTAAWEFSQCLVDCWSLSTSSILRRNRLGAKESRLKPICSVDKEI